MAGSNPRGGTKVAISLSRTVHRREAQAQKTPITQPPTGNRTLPATSIPA